jgi:hypothetical protein
VSNWPTRGFKILELESHKDLGAKFVVGRVRESGLQVIQRHEGSWKKLQKQRQKQHWRRRDRHTQRASCEIRAWLAQTPDVRRRTDGCEVCRSVGAGRQGAGHRGGKTPPAGRGGGTMISIDQRLEHPVLSSMISHASWDKVY